MEKAPGNIGYVNFLEEFWRRITADFVLPRIKLILSYPRLN